MCSWWFFVYIADGQAVSGNEILLRIKRRPYQYSFFVADPKDLRCKELDKLDTRYLSTEVAGGFTGVMIGL